MEFCVGSGFIRSDRFHLASQFLLQFGSFVRACQAQMKGVTLL
jgi:hypothetical protein